MHAINFIDDDELPAGHDFMFIDIPEGGLIFYRESAISPQSLEDSWAAYRALGGPNRGQPDRERPWMALVASAG